MKKWLIFLLVIGCTFGASAKRKRRPVHRRPATATHHQLPDKQQITHLLMNQKNAWNDGNLEQYMLGYWKSDSLVFVSRKGVTKGWSSTLENYRKSYPDKASMGTLSFDILSVQIISPSYAYVTGKWNLKRGTDKGDVGGQFTLLLRRIKEKWVIISDHSS